MTSLSVSELGEKIANARAALVDGRLNDVKASLSSYYAGQPDRGYTTLAGQVVNNTGLSGETANYVLQLKSSVTIGSGDYYRRKNGVRVQFSV